MERYTPQEVEEQLSYLQNAHNVTSDERAKVVRILNDGKRDQGAFSWVKCPIWRFRLYELAKTGIVGEDLLNAIARYLLEGDRRAIAREPFVR